MEHLTLLELNTKIAEVLKTQMEPSYWVVAEIGQLQINRSGHCYLELLEKEGQQIMAKNRATIWSHTYRYLSVWFQGITGQPLKAGMNILFNATIQFHEVYGFSLNIRDIDAQYTLGEREKRRRETIEQLMQDGVFEMNQALPLPAVPQHVAVVSSNTAAGYSDFINHLTNNEYGYQLQTELFDSVMQGDRAESSMIDALHRVYQRSAEFDLLVIIRGGGASLDLDCFDGYDLAAHVAQFPLPVITGIGHERDETITDLVAHTKLKTPTAVAVFIIAEIAKFEMRLMDYFAIASERFRMALETASERIDKMSFRFQRTAQVLLNENGQQINGLIKDLDFARQTMLGVHEQRLAESRHSLRRSGQMLERQADRLQFLQKELQSLDPKSVLKRGFALATINGVNLDTIPAIEEGAEITINTHKKIVTSRYLNESSK
jgi:exodeoxyribonuclease VII large subunit